jgi:HEPN domain-containing protein
VEKYIKAYLVFLNIDFPKTHDIGALLELVATRNTPLSEDLTETDDLSDYGVEIRYPSYFPDVTIEDAKRAVELARKTREAILDALKMSPKK